LRPETKRLNGPETNKKGNSKILEDIIGTGHSEFSTPFNICSFHLKKKTEPAFRAALLFLPISIRTTGRLRYKNLTQITLIRNKW
jgi:hypothetical protein